MEGGGLKFAKKDALEFFGLLSFDHHFSLFLL